ncbi:UDP-phosphate galactose phosphotransferase [Virgibacillus pantothenticus]|uniref:sugar transferase n=1 Tax=Virgibacillus TaxID=84406 RepID=UPI00090AC783|nr:MULTISPECIES: sugar transferase [Virgibacillus]API92969.1 UDP-phosphate galactose phosphotransferase [Virgibacillus sp. 6R]MBS7428494.1 sugar transferase [Virgibacillus sp. 19R1-5]GIP62951.1 UDP-phosphate galactose phosphotransferase [Virgibacillus pantothenticus]
MYQKLIKRLLDIFVSLLMLPIIIILIIIISPIIYFEDKGPIFYNAGRRGLNGKIFKMYKFRSMYNNAPDIRNKDLSTYNSDYDPRVTKVGNFLRKTSLDEVLQFLNVLKGDMSIIGPRPNLTSKPLESFNYIERKRITIKPGITGYNQAYFRNSIPQEEKYINDCYYVDNISFLLDFKIILQTFKTVFTHKNINSNKTDKDKGLGN